MHIPIDTKLSKAEQYEPCVEGLHALRGSTSRDSYMEAMDSDQHAQADTLTAALGV